MTDYWKSKKMHLISLLRGKTSDEKTAIIAKFCFENGVSQTKADEWISSAEHAGALISEYEIINCTICEGRYSTKFKVCPNCTLKEIDNRESMQAAEARKMQNLTELRQFKLQTIDKINQERKKLLEEGKEEEAEKLKQEMLDLHRSL